MFSASSFFKAPLRRFQQGILEQIGAATSSKDASFDLYAERFKQLEESLLKINHVVLTYLSSLRRVSEDARETAVSLDFFAASDFKHNIRAATEESVRFIDALQASLRVHTGIKTAVLVSVEKVVLTRIIKPLGLLLKQLPGLKRQMENRRELCTGW